MDTENAINFPGSQPRLDTASTLTSKGSVTDLAGGLNPVGGPEGSAGVAPHGTESVQGKDETEISVETTEDFFRHMMESNTPPLGVSATNRDWHFPWEE